MLGVISFPDMDLSIPRKVRTDVFKLNDNEKVLLSNINTECFPSFQMFPLPLLYAGNQISGLFGTQRLK